MKSALRALAVAGATALVTTGCGTSSTSGTSGGSGGSGGSTAAGPAGRLKTGPGVSAQTITLGALTDLTGPYASLDKSVVNAQQLYFQNLDADGGVCGRKVSLLVDDDAYDTQKAVSLFTAMKPQVLAIPNIIGSSIIAKLSGQLDADHILTLTLAQPATMLGHPSIQLVGSTYDIDMINGLAYLAKEAGLQAGDKVGHLYFEGDYGNDALIGSKFEAGKLGLTIVPLVVKPTDTDLTAQVATLEQQGVKAVLISAGPTQTAGLAAAAAKAGLDVPIMTNAAGYAPQLLATKAGPALEKNLYVSSFLTPIDPDDPTWADAVAAYRSAYPGRQLDQGVALGWINAEVMGQDLKAACAAGDLTREGLLAAHRKQTSIKAGGNILDFSDPAKPSSYSSAIERPDVSAAAGLKLVKAVAEDPSVSQFQVP